MIKYIWIIILFFWLVSFILDLVANFLVAKHAEIKYKIIYSFTHLDISSVILVTCTVVFVFIYSLCKFWF